MPTPTTSESTRTRAHQRRLAGRARMTLAGRSKNTAECRRLGLLLGLFEQDHTGSLTTTDPWKDDPGNTFRQQV